MIQNKYNRNTYKKDDTVHFFMTTDGKVDFSLHGDTALRYITNDFQNILSFKKVKLYHLAGYQLKTIWNCPYSKKEAFQVLGVVTGCDAFYYEKMANDYPLIKELFNIAVEKNLFFAGDETRQKFFEKVDNDIERYKKEEEAMATVNATG